MLNGFSAHADQPALLEFVEGTRAAGPLRHVALVHGEPRAQDVFRQLLLSRGFPSVRVPEPGETWIV